MSNGGTPIRGEAAEAVGGDVQHAARLRRLAQRYRIRGDGTIRPVADVAHDLRSRHGIDLTVRQVFDLLKGKAGQ